MIQYVDFVDLKMHHILQSTILACKIPPLQNSQVRGRIFPSEYSSKEHVSLPHCCI